MLVTLYMSGPVGLGAGAGADGKHCRCGGRSFELCGGGGASGISERHFPS